MKFLIIGKNGQLGQELIHLFEKRGIKYTSVGSKELDITNRRLVEDYFSQNKPEFIFDCAAYTDVEGAEEEPGKSVNFKVNYEGTKNIATSANEIGATVVYISTDYVFDGSYDGSYASDSKTNPINEYGKAKLEGENELSKICRKYYIIRTSWLYGEFGNNFVYTMLKLSENHDELKVIDDQIGRPTWTKSLARFMLYLVENKSNYGIYQLSNEGTATWYTFAKYILNDKNTNVLPVSSDEFPQKAKRPENSIMSLDKVKKTGFKNVSWKQAVDEFLGRK